MTSVSYIAHSKFTLNLERRFPDLMEEARVYSEVTSLRMDYYSSKFIHPRVIMKKDRNRRVVELIWSELQQKF